MNITITSLNARHQRSGFACGEKSLEIYLQRYAKQDAKRRISRVFVASPVESPEQVVGYYTLSAYSFSPDSMPEERRRRLPGYPIPAVMLGRLAIDQGCQRAGLGRILVADALQRVKQASEVMAVYALAVDALHEEAGAYYQQFGFIAFKDQPLKLFLPL